MSSSNKNVNLSHLQPRDLINFTIRVNKNYSAPDGLGSFIPGSFLSPYPSEDLELKSSFLKFNFDEAARLKPPIINPEMGLVKKGTMLEIKYPEADKDIFFRYVTDENFIPTFFSGEIVTFNLNFLLFSNLKI
jgi:hypothetical protein